MKYAFKDSADGYYELDLAEGEEFPEWTTNLIPCDVISNPTEPQLISPISPRQIRQALTALNFRSGVESAVATGDQNLKDWWEFSSYFERNHPIVVSMGTQLGVSSEQLDALWILAGAL